MNSENPTKYQLHKEEKSAVLRSIRRKKLLRGFAVWLAGAAVLGGAGWGMVKLASAPKPELLLASAVSELDQTKGNAQSGVLLVEYSDFQCPACAAYHRSIIKQLVEEMDSQVKFVYRHFPLAQHAQAKLAAYAAEAAGKQGKFWEMHDLIFAGQKEWAGNRKAGEIFEKYAVSLGLDIEKFADDLDSKEIKNKVENDYQSGLNSGVNSTPTFFLNGKQMQNPRSYEEFRNAILNS